MVDNLFDVFLDLNHKYLTEKFCVYVHKGYWSVILFTVGPLCGLDIKVIVAS